MKTAYDIIIQARSSPSSPWKPPRTEEVRLPGRRPSANKTEIKKAVSEKIFGVKVEKVTTIRMDGKLKSARALLLPAVTASYKKAVVKLTADSKTIEFFEGMV